MSLIGTFVFVCPVPAGDELTGDGHMPHFTVPREGDLSLRELGVDLADEGREVCGFWDLEEEGVVVLKEELDGERGSVQVEGVVGQ